MNPVLHWTKYDSLRSGRVHNAWAEESQMLGTVQRSKCIWSEWAKLLKSLSHLFLCTCYLGWTKKLVHTDLIEVYQRTIVDHDRLHNVTTYSNHIKCLATLGKIRSRSTIESSVSIYAEACNCCKYCKYSCVSMSIVISHGLELWVINHSLHPIHKCITWQSSQSMCGAHVRTWS